MWTYACTRCGHSYTVVAPIVPEPPVEYGLRNSNVTVTTEHHEYVYASGTLLRETITTTDAEGNTTTETLDFVYDLNGSPYALNYTNGTNTTQTYYYITNVQGDVTHLVTTDGTVVAEYGYDAWGKVTAATGSMAEVNPLRYRGYYYDAESGFYYLQSRYYDPAVYRFINADNSIYIGITGSTISYNLFAYCENNPAVYLDTSGKFLGALIGGLVGAGVGALFGTLEAAWTGGDIGEGALSGAISGGICGAVMGSPVAGSLGVVAVAAVGAGSSIVGSVTAHAVCNKKFDAQFWLETAEGAVWAAAGNVFFGYLGNNSKVARTLGGKVVEEVLTSTVTFVAKVLFDIITFDYPLVKQEVK